MSAPTAITPARPSDAGARARGSAPPGGPLRPLDLLLVALLAIAVRVPALLASRSLVFDDGVFGSSVVAMRNGGLPYRDVFSSQGPLFLPLAWLGDLVTFRTIDSPRAVAVAAGVAIALATYLAGRELTTRPRALLATGLVLASGSVLWVTAPLAADGPAGACAVGAVALALRYRRAPSRGQAVAIGVLAGVAFSIKLLLVLPALVAVALLVLVRRRTLDVVLVPVVALAVTVVASVPWGLRRVLEQSVLYHTDATSHREPLSNLEVLARTLVRRDLPLVVVGAVAVVAAAVALVRRRVTRPASPAPLPDGRDARPTWLDRLGGGRVPVATWAALVLVMLVTEDPMWRSHVSHLVPPLALLVATSRVRLRALVIAAVASVPLWGWWMRPLLVPERATGADAAITRALRALPDGAMAISDEPGIVWRAGRTTPDRFVDTSILRITSPRASVNLTEGDVVRDAASPRVCAVVRWSDVRFGSFPGLARRLRAEGYRQVYGAAGAPAALWVKRPCRPAGEPPPAWPAGRDRRTSAAAAPSRSPG